MEENYEQKRSIALLLVVAMLFTFVSVIAACKPQDECEKNGHKLTAVAQKDATTDAAGYEAYWKCDVCGKMFSDKDGKTEITKPVEIPKLTSEPTPHVCGHKCPTCGKCTDNTCTDTVCKDKCPGHQTTPTHECKHVCPECGKCTDSTCTDPVCADKCQGHEDTDPAKEGVFTPIAEPVAGKYYMGMKCSGDVYYYLKGGMNGYYMATSTNKEEAVIVDLIADGDGWLLKQGNQYMEIENSNGHINAVYKATRTAGKNWAWDETYNIFTWEDGKYFYGTYGSFNTIGGGEYATHAADNYKAQLGTFGKQEVVQPNPESVTLNKSGTLYLAPQSGNYIQLNATVQPVAASQDVEWSSSNEQVATVVNGTVTYAGVGQTIITAMAKGTDKKVEITVVVTEKGSEENPLTINDVIELINSVDEGKIVGDGASKDFYIVGKVDEGSVFDSGWKFSMTDTSGTVSCEHDGFLYSGLRNQSGAMDGFEFLMQAKLQKENGSYKLVDVAIDAYWHPMLMAIQIDESVTVDMGGSAALTATLVPANASLGDNIEWHTSAEQTATVANGVVVGVAAGSAEITASVGEITSNKCTVTVNAVEVTKAVYDWTEKVGTKVLSRDTLKSLIDGDWLSYIEKNTVGQTEITAATGSGMNRSRTGWLGLGYSGKKATESSFSLTTTHQIKKITFKIVPYADTSSIQFSVNEQEYSRNKADGETWDGTTGSAFEIECTLSPATDTISVTIPATVCDGFSVVGMTLEW